MKNRVLLTKEQLEIKVSETSDKLRIREQRRPLHYLEEFKEMRVHLIQEKFLIDSILYNKIVL